MAALRVKIDFGNKGLLGPGKVRLLELIQKHGSIRSAAAAMDMSYRRAWLLLKELENIMGAPAIAPETGGAKGGGTTLTELGRTLVDTYRTIEQNAARSVASDLRLLAQMAKPTKAAGKRP